MSVYVHANANGSIENLRALVAQALPHELRYLDWYKEARTAIRAAALRHRLDWRILAGVVAAISPLRSWRTNVSDAVKLIEHLESGGSVDDAPISKPAGRRPLRAAAKFYAGDTSAIRGPKVTAFHANLIDPHGNDLVTVDSHAMLAWLGTTKRGSVKFSAKLRRQAAADYKQLAAELGVAPCAAQALVWVVRKRLVGSK